MMFTPLDFLHLIQIVEIFDDYGVASHNNQNERWARFNDNNYVLSIVEDNGTIKGATLFESGLYGTKPIYEYFPTYPNGLGDYNLDGVDRFLKHLKGYDTPYGETLNQYLSNKKEQEEQLTLKPNRW